MIAKIKRMIIKFLSYEKCAHKLALSCGMGIYIAFSPFVGLHTAMVFFFSWIFALNAAVVLAISMLINNPWTMVPVYGSGYAFGDWFLHLFGINHMELNPSWINGINSWISSSVGISGISFWAFLLGGNVLGIAFGIASYPLMKRYVLMLKQASQERYIKSKKTATDLAVSAAQKVKTTKTEIGHVAEVLVARAKGSYENRRAE